MDPNVQEMAAPDPTPPTTSTLQVALDTRGMGDAPLWPRRRIAPLLMLIAAVTLVAVVAGALRIATSGRGGARSTVAAGHRPPCCGRHNLALYWSAAQGTYDVAEFDPATVFDHSAVTFANLLFDGLVVPGRNLQPELWGADHLSVSADGLTYTFHLRAGQAFSDGLPVKPSDYAWSLDRALNPCLASRTTAPLTALKDADAFIHERCASGMPAGPFHTLVGDSILPDDGAGTLALTLQQPTGSFLAALTAPVAYVVERSAVTGAHLGAVGAWLSHLASGSGGSGMFMVKFWDHQGNLALVPNPHWWGYSPGESGRGPYFTELDFRLYESADVKYAAFEDDPTAGVIDQIPGVQAAVKTQPYYRAVPLSAVTGLSLNWKVNPFSNADARAAFCLTVNRDQLSQIVYGGATLPSWHIVPQGTPGYNPALLGLDGVPTTGDFRTAEQHWRAYLATLSGRPVPPVMFSYDGGDTQQADMAHLLQADWDTALGVTVSLSPLDDATLPAQGNRQTLQAFRSTLSGDTSDPQTFLAPFITGATDNPTGASVPAADALLRQADALADPAQQSQRLSLHNQAEQILIDNEAFCPLSQSQGIYGVRPWVRGDFTESALGTFPDDAWLSGYIGNANP